MLRWTLLGLLAAAGLGASAAWAADAARIGPAAAKALAAGERARLLVAFRPDAADQRAKRAPGEVAQSLLEAVPEGSATLLRGYQRLDAMAVEADARAVEAWLRDPRVLRVDVDEGGLGGLGESQPLAGITPVKLAGLDGAGTTVAVIDSGHATGNPTFAGRVAAEYCYCSGNGGCCPGGGSTRSGAGAAADDQGHGTHVSSIVLGSSAPEGAAPAAELVSIKVLDQDNGFCCISDVLAGLDRVLADHPEVDAINLSLGTNQKFAGSCDNATSWTIAGAQAVAALRARGTLVMAASLNGGSRSSITMPACLSQVTAVGAVWDANLGNRNFAQGGFSCSEPTAADKLTCFTNTSPMLDLVAPGAVVTAASRFGGTANLSGTSMASPMVAGCVALLRQVHSTASAGAVESALLASETLIDDPGTGRRYPRLDCAKALAVLGGAPSSPDPAQVGTQYWLTGAGIVEDKVLRAELTSATGTAFGDAFRPDDVQRRRWGAIEIVFTACNEATFQWDSTGDDSAGFGTGGYPLLRLAASEASIACEEVGFEAVGDLQWIAGSWYGGAGRSGEGLFLDVLANGVVVVAFFTHRPEGLD